MWPGSESRLEISARSIRSTIPAILLHPIRKGGRDSIVAIDQKRPLVNVAMSGKHEIDSGVFQNGIRVLPHLG